MYEYARFVCYFVVIAGHSYGQETTTPLNTGNNNSGSVSGQQIPNVPSNVAGLQLPSIPTNVNQVPNTVGQLAGNINNVGQVPLPVVGQLPPVGLLSDVTGNVGQLPASVGQLISGDANLPVVGPEASNVGGSIASNINSPVSGQQLPNVPSNVAGLQLPSIPTNVNQVPNPVGQQTGNVGQVPLPVGGQLPPVGLLSGVPGHVGQLPASVGQRGSVANLPVAGPAASNVGGSTASNINRPVSGQQLPNVPSNVAGLQWPSIITNVNQVPNPVGQQTGNVGQVPLPVGGQLPPVGLLSGVTGNAGQLPASVGQLGSVANLPVAGPVASNVGGSTTSNINSPVSGQQLPNVPSNVAGLQLPSTPTNINQVPNTVGQLAGNVNNVGQVPLPVVGQLPPVGLLSDVTGNAGQLPASVGQLTSSDANLPIVGPEASNVGGSIASNINSPVSGQQLPNVPSNVAGLQLPSIPTNVNQVPNPVGQQTGNVGQVPLPVVGQLPPVGLLSGVPGNVGQLPASVGQLGSVANLPVAGPVASNVGGSTTSNINNGALIKRPCQVSNVECIRNYFARHALCKETGGPVPDPYIRPISTIFFTGSNLTITAFDAVYSGLNGRIEDFYINRATDNMVILIQYNNVTFFSEEALYMFHRPAKEAIVNVDYIFLNSRSLSTTTVIPQINHLLLEKSETFAFVDEPAQITYGPKAFVSSDPGVPATAVALASNPSKNTQEFFLTEGAFIAATYIQCNICNFGLEIL